MINRAIDYFLKTPDAFLGNWKGYTLNQLGHGILIGALLTPVLGLAIVLFLYALWESVQYKYFNASVSDCLEDFSYVATCAMAVTITYWLFIPAGFFLVVGAFYRYETGAANENL